MPDPKAVSEAPANKASEQDVAEEQIESAVDVDAVADAVASAEEESSEASEESSTSEQKDGVELPDNKEEEVSDLEEFTNTEVKKDNVQKRIDQLTAQLKELKSENEKLKGSEPQKNNKPKYTDEQLKGALDKALSEGDSGLAWEIIQYKTEKIKEDLVEMYENEKSTITKAQQQVQQEWNRVVNDYSKVWDDGNGREIYNGAKNELNLGSENSLLYRLALNMYYTAKDDDGNLIYSRQGGQRQVVADAVNQILRKRKLSPNDPEKRKMERQLAKAKRKNSIPSTSSTDGESRRVKSSGDSLSDYLAERKKYRNERT